MCLARLHFVDDKDKIQTDERLGRLIDHRHLKVGLPVELHNGIRSGDHPERNALCLPHRKEQQCQQEDIFVKISHI